jgi:acetyl-CoA carboxylase carboxyl transferase beta subunit/acetyl-CoA carboxylase carboxyl transferase alpha subunit
MSQKKGSISSPKCPKCGTPHSKETLEEKLYICPSCEHYFSMPSGARISTLTEPDTFRELDRKLVSVDPLEFADLKSYRERLEGARRETGVREAVTTGVCRIAGHPAVLIVFDFAFLGGTMGSVVGEKIANAFEEATRRRMPVVSVAASGGARVQEGMLSLMQMAKVAAAVSWHDRERLAFISVLTDPTFGGVTASFASLGDVILAEPGAQIGFVGPRVIEQTTGIAPPKDSHHAETLLRAGLIDLVVKRENLPRVVGLLINHLRKQKPTRGTDYAALPSATTQQLPAWQQVTLARHPFRPSARYFISRMTNRFLELHGDRWNGDDPAIIGGLGKLDGRTVLMIGQERGGTTEEKAAANNGMAFSEGYRKSMRLMQLAAKFDIPVVTLVDCPNAQSSFEAEHCGIAHALARNLAGMSNLPTPIVSAIIGQGGSGGALALGVADRVLMLEHAIYSVISPEGAAAILYRDAKQAEVVSEGLKLTAHDLLRLGIIDAVIPEPGEGGHLDPAGVADALKRHLIAALREVSEVPTRRLLANRYKKYRNIGQGGIYWRELVRTQVRDAFGFLMPRASRTRRQITRPDESFQNRRLQQKS